MANPKRSFLAITQLPRAKKKRLTQNHSRSQTDNLLLKDKNRSKGPVIQQLQGTSWLFKWPNELQFSQVCSKHPASIPRSF